MRKIAILAMFAIVAAMVPASVASSTPLPGTLDGVGSLMLINPSSTSHKFVFIKNDGKFVLFDAPAPSQQEVQVTTGDHHFVICNAPPGGFAPADETCASPAAPAVPIPPYGSGTFHVDSNDILNAVIAGLTTPSEVPFGQLDVQENDDHKTETDHAKLTVYNFTTFAFDACVGGEHVISLPAQVVGGHAPMQVAEFDSKDGEGQDFQLFSVGLAQPFPGTCTGGVLRDQGFPTGSNLVVNFLGATGSSGCGDLCGYLIFPGEDPPNSSQTVQAFCDVVLQAANITPWLQDLVAEVEVGNPDTYPSKERVEKVITRIAELLEKGAQTAPADIKPAWLAATAAFVQTGQFAAADYNFNNLSQDDLRTAVEKIDNPAADDEEAAAATAALTAWVPVNCFGAVTAEPSFTG